LPPEMVADVIEGFVLELEDRDRLLERVRNRLEQLAPAGAPPFDIHAWLPE
jgi:hypothetical protein